MDLPIAEITRVRLQPTGRPEEPVELRLSIRDAPLAVARAVVPTDREPVAQLIAALAGLDVS